MKILKIVVTSLLLILVAGAAHSQSRPDRIVAPKAEPSTLIEASEPQIQVTVEPTTEGDSIANQSSVIDYDKWRKGRGLTQPDNLFIPKGQWIFGGTASYSTHSNDQYQFLVIDGINSNGYTFSLSAVVAYAFNNNMAAGGRFTYNRSLLKVDDAHMSIGDEQSGTTVVVKDFYTLKHSYTTSAIWRQYIPLGRNKRFALFNEMQLSFGITEAKFANDFPVKGTYQSGYTASVGVAPGIVAFATNNMAVEVNVGVMGFNYSRTTQTHNQVIESTVESSILNFKVNILSVGLGIVFYL